MGIEILKAPTEVVLPLVLDDLSVGDRVYDAMSTYDPAVPSSQFGTIAFIENRVIHIRMDTGELVVLDDEEYCSLEVKLRDWEKPLPLSELYYGARISQKGPDGHREYATIAFCNPEVGKFAVKKDGDLIASMKPFNSRSEREFLNWVIEG